MSARLPRWTPFVREPLHPPEPAKIRALAAQVGVHPAVILERFRETAREEQMWSNSRYVVFVKRTPWVLDGTTLVHLSIKRHDKEPVGPERFRDFQRIKNEFVGEECEGVELYPAEARLVDTSNQYHLWCVEGVPAQEPESGPFRFPLGYEARLVFDRLPDGPAKQQPIRREEH